MKVYGTWEYLFRFSPLVQLSNTAVQLTTLSMMSFILKRANSNIEYLLEKAEWHGSDMYTHDMMGDLVQQYREILTKVSSGRCRHHARK